MQRFTLYAISFISDLQAFVSILFIYYYFSFSFAYCLTLRHGDKLGASVVCAFQNVVMICPLQQTNTSSDIISAQLLAANQSFPFRGIDIYSNATNTLVDIGVTCSFRALATSRNSPSPASILRNASLDWTLERLALFGSDFTGLGIDEISLTTARAATAQRYMAVATLALETSSNPSIFQNTLVNNELRFLIASSLNVSLSTLSIPPTSIFQYNITTTENLESVVRMYAELTIYLDIDTLEGSNVTDLWLKFNRSQIELLAPANLSAALTYVAAETIEITKVLNFTLGLREYKIPETVPEAILEAGETYDIECSMMVPASRFQPIEASSLVRNLTLLAVFSAQQNVSCVQPFYQVACHAPVRRRVPDPFFGDKYVVETTPQSVIANYLLPSTNVPQQCNGYFMRLTPQKQFQKGSIWHRNPQRVIDGFSTSFTFQISNPSRKCKTVKSLSKGTHLYTHCIPEGGDGFAFVIKGFNGTYDSEYFTKPENPDEQFSWQFGNDTLWKPVMGFIDGESIGYAGLTNAIAIEFDTFHNSKTARYTVEVEISVAGMDPGAMKDKRVWRSFQNTVTTAVQDAGVHVDIKMQEALKTEPIPQILPNDVTLKNFRVSTNSNTMVVYFSIRCVSSLSAHAVKTALQRQDPYSMFRDLLRFELQNIGNNVTFDTATLETTSIGKFNPEPYLNHIAVHSFGRGNLTSHSHGMLASWSLPPSEYPTGFSDGQVHTARIEFSRGLQMPDVYRSMSSTTQSLQMMTDVSELNSMNPSFNYHHSSLR
jgi:hypothetical protein